MYKLSVITLKTAASFQLFHLSRSEAFERHISRPVYRQKHPRTPVVGAVGTFSLAKALTMLQWQLSSRFQAGFHYCINEWD